MANPFKRADRDGAPSIRPTPPESAETPMPDPTETPEIPVETRRPTGQPARTASKRRDANGATAPPPTAKTPPPRQHQPRARHQKGPV